MKTFKMLLKLSILFVFYMMSNKALAYSKYHNPIKDSCKSFYMGLEAIVSEQRIDRMYGGNIFPKTSQGLNISLGKMINNNFGIEIGSDLVKKKSRDRQIYFPGVINGVQINFMNQYNLCQSTIKIPKYYFGILSNLDFNNSFSLNLLVGLSLMKVKANTLYISDIFGIINDLINYNTSKVVPFVKLSLAKEMFNNFEIKATLGIINFKKIQISDNLGGATPTMIKIKSNTNFGIGFNYYLL